MSVLADIFVASPDEAAEYDADPKRFEANAASWKRFTVLELSTLWALLQGREWDVETIDLFENVFEIAGGERTIARLPEEFLNDLLGTDDGRLKQAVDAWAASDELNCEADEVMPFVEDLRRLAQAARSSGKSVYLWNCV